MSHSKPATADRALLQSLVSLLLTPVPSSASLPPALLSTLNSAHTRALKLLLGPSAVRQTLEQLEDLREKEGRRRDRRRERDERGRGRVDVGRGTGWVRETPGAWPGEAEAEGGELDADRKEYASQRRRVLALEAKLKRKRAQLAEYKALAALTANLDERTLSANTLAQPDSRLSEALSKTADLVPRVNRRLASSESDFVATKRAKLSANGRRGGAAPVQQIKLEGQSAGAALLDMF